MKRKKWRIFTMLKKAFAGQSQNIEVVRFSERNNSGSSARIKFVRFRSLRSPKDRGTARENQNGQQN
ncbi:MAG: hypothetical protein LBN05_00740 [Oscillospiraceae bacterium]|jgi:hypothetical protein|nr:hypothetical protein [Oscillospiraceae bacterium]